MAANMKRILLECTQIYESRGTTGIPRVVRNLAESGPAAASEQGIELVPVIVRGRRFYPVQVRPAGHDTHPTASVSFLRKLEGRLGAPFGPPLTRAVQRVQRRMAKSLHPRTFLRFLDGLRRRCLVAELHATRQDVLVLSGSAWKKPVATAVELAKQSGMPVGFISYDLIPIDHPEYFSSRAVGVFREWIDHVLVNLDFALAISQTTRDRLWQYAIEQHGQRAWHPSQFTHFRQGSMIDTRRVGGETRGDLAAAFDDRQAAPTYLTVATIEPRKNHGFLLDAFDLVWAAHPQVRLCIAGRIGWLCNEVVDRIRSHPRYGRNLFLFNDLSDAELDYCYRHARAFLFPSKAEGYGLPIVEALSYGLPVMASDIPIHREVGGSCCGYFDLSDAAGLAQEIDRWERSGVVRSATSAGDFQPVTWADSARDFVRQTRQAVANVKEERTRQRTAA